MLCLSWLFSYILEDEETAQDICSWSADAEYRSRTAITSALKRLKGLLSSLGIHHLSQVYSSQPALRHTAKNPVFYDGTKHINVDCHFIRDIINDGLIDPSYVITTTQLADFFTKAFGER